MGGTVSWYTVYQFHSRRHPRSGEVCAQPLHNKTRKQQQQTRVVGSPMANAGLVLPYEESAARLMRYENSWAEIAKGNSAICSCAREVAAAVQEASQRCELANSGWQQLHAELQSLPQTAAMIHDMAHNVTAACARMDALEHRLRDAMLAKAEQEEAKRRQALILEVHEQQEKREANLYEQAQTAARVAEMARCQLERERERVFQEQFEAQRRYLVEHGNLEKVIVRASPSAPESVMAQCSLAEVAPCVGDTAELDQFYDDE